MIDASCRAITTEHSSEIQRRRSTSCDLGPQLNGIELMRIYWQIDVADTIAIGARDIAKDFKGGATSPIYRQAKLRTCDDLYERVGPTWY